MIVMIDSGARIEIPFSTDDISFADFCEFKAKESAFIEFLKVEDTEFEASMYLIEVIETIVKGDLSDLLYSLENENILSLMDNDFLFNFDDEISVLRIYIHIITLLKKVDLNLIEDTKELRVRNGEDEYVLPVGRCIRLMTAQNLTVGEMLETLEFQRRFLGGKETGNLQDIANLDFELGLTEVAILCRKQGEKLPHKKAQFDEWLQKRIHDIQHIPLTNVLRIRFFLLSCLKDSEKMMSLDTFGRANQTFINQSKNQIINRQ